MGVLSNVKSQDGNTVELYLDGQWFLSMPARDYLKYTVYARDEMSQIELEELGRKVLYERARERALRYVALSEKSCLQVLDKLKSWGYDEGVSVKALAYLKEAGYVDDARFARKFVEEKLRNKASSIKLLRYELEKRGIKGELAEEVLLPQTDREEERAMAAGQKKFSVLKGEPLEKKQKLVAFLQRQGFSYSMARRVSEELGRGEV